MPATIGSIDAALFATLAGLRADNGGGPFATLERLAGEATNSERERARVARATTAGTPALLLMPEGGAFAPAQPAVPALGGFVDTAVWRVFVVATDLGGDDAALAGQPATVGVLDLVTLVLGRLAGLAVEGLHGSSRVELVDWRPVSTKPGVYVYLVRVRAKHFVDCAPRAPVGEPLEDGPGDVGLPESAGIGEPIAGFNFVFEPEE